MKIYHQTIHLQTAACTEFIDVTDVVADRVRTADVNVGLINVQTMHTTTAIIVNENEPLLVEDMKRAIERAASRTLPYQHDDFTVRTVNLDVDECRNGHSHCQALFLNTAATLNIVDGKLRLGKWQRIFFIELDQAKERMLSLMIIGQ
jgi:secondary thiamine-phosphate synthase enzyme